MEILDLLFDARAAGLTISVDGDELVLSGPPEAAAAAERVGAAKGAVIAWLKQLAYWKSTDYFANWVQRPDAHGRMGWERPTMKPADRWWAYRR